MFFIKKDQVDEDVRNMQQYVFTDTQLQEKLAAEAQDERKRKENADEFTAKDILAMSIAAFEVILPYMLAVAAAMAGVFLLFYWMGTH